MPIIYQHWYFWFLWREIAIQDESLVEFPKAVQSGSSEDGGAPRRFLKPQGRPYIRVNVLVSLVSPVLSRCSWDVPAPLLSSLIFLRLLHPFLFLFENRLRSLLARFSHFALELFLPGKLYGLRTWQVHSRKNNNHSSPHLCGKIRWVYNVIRIGNAKFTSL